MPKFLYQIVFFRIYQVHHLEIKDKYEAIIIKLYLGNCHLHWFRICRSYNHYQRFIIWL